MSSHTSSMRRALAEIMVRERLDYASARERLIDLRHAKEKEFVAKLAAAGPLPAGLENPPGRDFTARWVDVRLAAGATVTIDYSRRKQ